MGRLLVFTNAVEGRQEEFDAWYDDIHLREVLELGPFTGAQRFVLADTQLTPEDRRHRCVAIYEFEGDPDVAVAALHAAAPTFNMSDALDLAVSTTLVVEHAPRVTAESLRAASGTTA